MGNPAPRPRQPLKHQNTVIFSKVHLLLLPFIPYPDYPKEDEQFFQRNSRVTDKAPMLPLGNPPLEDVQSQPTSEAAATRETIPDSPVLDAQPTPSHFQMLFNDEEKDISDRDARGGGAHKQNC